MRAGVAELVDATDLKSVGEILVGSSPTPGTKYMKEYTSQSTYGGM